MVTKKDVIQCYQALLGRDPESEATIIAQMNHQDLNSLKREILASAEYQYKIQTSEKGEIVTKTALEHPSTAHVRKEKYPATTPCVSMPENPKWLVIGNCQTTGLVNSLTILSPDVDVEGCDVWQLSKDRDYWNDKIASYQHLIVISDCRHSEIVDFRRYKNITWFPSFIFQAFHPDMCYVICPDGIFKSPMDEYNSCLIFAAYQSNLSIQETFQLFNDDVYRSVGFYDFWEYEKKSLIERFDECELDIRASLVHWVRSGCFMHSMNHPKINTVYDIARAITQKIRKQYAESPIRPHDNLTVGPIYPIYPEIADQFGLKDGSYLFKPMGSYKQMDLKAFIEGSFQAYQHYEKHELTIYPLYEKTYNRIMSYI